MKAVVKPRKARTSFGPVVQAVAIRGAERGLTNEQIAKGIGCTPHSLSRWRTRYPKFRAAMDKARLNISAEDLEFEFSTQAQIVQQAVDLIGKLKSFSEDSVGISEELAKQLQEAIDSVESIDIPEIDFDDLHAYGDLIDE